MKRSILSKNRVFTKAGIILVWLAIWEIASHIVNNGILLVGPIEVLLCLKVKIFEPAFWQSIGTSLLRIALGYLLGSVTGAMLAILSYKCRIIKEFLSPFMAFVKATPVASFVVLFLIWWHADALSIAISTCIVLPQIYVNMLQGLENVDEKMLKMANAYKLSFIDRINYIYRPSLATYLEGAVKVSVGMAWKSGIAAEVIGTPKSSIGEGLYMSKIYLDTESVLAWTLMIIVLSVLSEYFLLHAYRMYNRLEFKCVGSKRKAAHTDKLKVMDVSKNYGEKNVLTDYNLTVDCAQTKVLDWESGTGKTTLFKIILGEESADSGSVITDGAEISILYQEDRLCEDYSALKNVEIITGDVKVAKEELVNLLDESLLTKPVKYLSGGQRRRVAVVRSVLSDADIYLLDEPFNGLDEKNRNNVSDYIHRKLSDKIVLIASHINDIGEKE